MTLRLPGASCATTRSAPATAVAWPPPLPSFRSRCKLKSLHTHQVQQKYGGRLKQITFAGGRGRPEQSAVSTAVRRWKSQGLHRSARGAAGSKHVPLRETRAAQTIRVVVFSEQQAHAGGFTMSLNFGNKRGKKKQREH